MKDLNEMTLDELIDWATGTFIIAIGTGEFRNKVSTVVQCVMRIGHRRGEKSGIAMERKRNRKRKAKK